MPDSAVPALLELDGVSKSFGRVVVADNLSLAIGPGDMVGIVGPNGAGKSSLFGLIAGDLRPSAGEIRFAGHPVTRLGAAARCRLGIGRTFQVPKPFGAMTVFENVLVAAQQGAGLRRQAGHAAAAAAIELTGLGADDMDQLGDLGIGQAAGDLVEQQEPRAGWPGPWPPPSRLRRQQDRAARPGCWRRRPVRSAP